MTFQEILDLPSRCNGDRYRVIGTSAPPIGAVSAFALEDGTISTDPILAIAALELYDVGPGPEESSGPFYALDCFSGLAGIHECVLDGAADNWLGMATSPDAAKEMYSDDAKAYAGRLKLPKEVLRHE